MCLRGHYRWGNLNVSINTTIWMFQSISTPTKEKLLGIDAFMESKKHQRRMVYYQMLVRSFFSEKLQCKSLFWALFRKSMFLERFLLLIYFNCLVIAGHVSQSVHLIQRITFSRRFAGLLRIVCFNKHFLMILQRHILYPPSCELHQLWKLNLMYPKNIAICEVHNLCFEINK